MCYTHLVFVYKFLSNNPRSILYYLINPTAAIVLIINITHIAVPMTQGFCPLLIRHNCFAFEAVCKLIIAHYSLVKRDATIN